MRTEILPCFDQHKSFHGKAKILYKDDGGIYLQSYDTIVGGLSKETGEFIRMWNDYSDTTMRHVKSFCIFFSVPFGNKRWWCSLPVHHDLSSTQFSATDFDEFMKEG